MEQPNPTPPASPPPPAPNGEALATPAPAPIEAPAAPTPEETAAGATERDEKGRFRNPLQPRIDELTRARREAEREAAYWRSQAAAAKPVPEPPKEPVPQDFDDYGAYVKALTRFNAEAIAKEAIDQDRAQTRAQSASEQKSQQWRERSAELAKTIPDLPETLAASEVQIANFIGEQLLESEIGPQIAYHLTKNPDLAAKLNTMTPVQAAKEIGKLEVQLTKAAAATPTPPTPPADARTETPAPPAPASNTQNRRVSSAPPPMKPAAPGRSTQADLAKVGMDEYVEIRRAQGASWARR